MLRAKARKGQGLLAAATADNHIVPKCLFPLLPAALPEHTGGDLQHNGYGTPGRPFRKKAARHKKLV